MYLVISEKPSVAQSIAKVLGAYKREDGYLSGRDCIVSWCLGHLAEYVMPEAYDEAYKKWSLEQLPIIPGKWKLEVARDKAKQFKVLKSLLTGTLVPVDYVVNACDAGREGELIFKRIYDLSGSSLPVKRLWISSMEDKAILEGFANLKDSSAYRNLAEASVCRAQADWLVGMNGTRAFTKAYDYRLTVGRVQTPTLAMLVERSRAINDFQKEQYFVTHIQSGSVDAVSEHLADRDEAERIAGICAGKEAQVLQVRKEMKTAAPPRLYDLTSLQRDANRLFGFTAKRTLELAQSLYEKKLLTYPRTDSQYLTEDMEETANELIRILFDVLPFADEKTQEHSLKRVLNSKKVSDHHAIVPTAEVDKTDLSELPEAERKILMMVGTRLLTATSESYRYLSVKAELDCCGYRFETGGKTVVDLGWKKYEDAMKEFLRADREKADEEGAKSVPDLDEGQILHSVETKVTEHWTKPPAPYTEDSLLAAMERAGNADMEADVERKGLGTPATRAGIIEKLISGGYADRKKKQIIATEAGSKMIALMPEYLTSAKMTADWENRLLLMERGEVTASDFMNDIYSLVNRIVDGCRNIPESEKIHFAGESGGKDAVGVCPVCGSIVREGKANYYCANRDCSFALWKENRYLSSMKKKIDRKMAADLLADGKAHAKDFYSARTGHNFEADLCLEVSRDGKTSFRMEFPKSTSDKRK